MSTRTTPDLETTLENLDPGTLEVIDPRELRQIASAVDAVADAQQRAEAAVIAARRADYSWGKIAIALGVTRQAAHERYSGLAG